MKLSPGGVLVRGLPSILQWCGSGLSWLFSYPRLLLLCSGRGGPSRDTLIPVPKIVTVQLVKVSVLGLRLSLDTPLDHNGPGRSARDAQEQHQDRRRRSGPLLGPAEDRGRPSPPARRGP